jgi:ABC-type branched-subunit amino acid transport system ATPase component
MSGSLAVSSLRAGYGGSLIVDDVSLTVGPGDSLAVLGPNGSGKSTLARAVLGLCDTYGGEVTWNGENLIGRPTWQRVRAGLGYVPQVANVFPSLTVHENLQVSSAGMGKAEVQEAMADVYELFPGLAQRLRVMAGHLSGGERRMLSFAAALVQRPSLLVLDEPTSDLSPVAIDTISDRIGVIVDEMKVPLLLIEQNVPMALALSKRFSVLVRGKIQEEAPSRSADLESIADIFLERI